MYACASGRCGWISLQVKPAGCSVENESVRLHYSENWQLPGHVVIINWLQVVEVQYADLALQSEATAPLPVPS